MSSLKETDIVSKCKVSFDFKKGYAYIEELDHEVVLQDNGKDDDMTRLFTKVEAIIQTHNDLADIKKKVKKDTEDYLKNSGFIEELREIQNG